MQELLQRIHIKVHSGLYHKDPETSVLGQKILQESIPMIHEMGFEHFTFKKLGERIQSTEASIYRYFENKHRLLVYLSSWYWAWLEYRMVFGTNNLASAEERLAKAIEIAVEPWKEPLTHGSINIYLLNQIIIAESSKSFLLKEVDAVNKEGFYAGYKQLCKRLSGFIAEVNPAYANPTALASTVMEGAHLQVYFAAHLPSLTDINMNNEGLSAFFKHLVLTTLKQ
ncbi:TetR/AcrR family transcriptional regulator [Cytophagales bacterium LB-30]|uniref:TetR/AcrR family transcriptional regulator n=1 Tax=Shiella aurantiaca TaxID=3058365 RepID=A0ABT8F8C4_9BACT|nr:TetR/AcrR family transcriptional regulator [Shiella aurantiaca]MDN4166737.1 TetR/AcrR family transcriptional regulator [Shiella aurantiaca]